MVLLVPDHCLLVTFEGVELHGHVNMMCWISCLGFSISNLKSHIMLIHIIKSRCFMSFFCIFVKLPRLGERADLLNITRNLSVAKFMDPPYK